MRFISFCRNASDTLWSSFTCKLLWRNCCSKCWIHGVLLLRSGLVQSHSFLAFRIHLDERLRVSVHTERDQFLIVVINWIKVLQEKITEKEVTIIVLVEWVFSNSELTNSLSLMEISSWAQFEYGLSNLESYWFNFLSNFSAALKALAESWVRFTVEIFQVISPLILKYMVLLWWNS